MRVVGSAFNLDEPNKHFETQRNTIYTSLL